MLVFVGLSIALDIEPILGAFLAGSVFAVVFRSRGVLEQQLNGFSYGFLIPIFFINVGLRFEVALLGELDVLAQALAVIGVAFAVKVIPSLVFALRGFGLREVLAAGLLLSARLSLIIAVATVGVELGFLTNQERAIAIMLAAVSSTVAPTLFRALAPPLPAAESQ
jgi:Kef-type K+ transport system membrane component KefB